MLVRSFKSTLAEVSAADLILLIVDASDPNASKEIAAVRAILEEIDSASVPSVLVYNKCDLLSVSEREALALSNHDAVFISAMTGEGIRSLTYRIVQEASAGDETVTALIPYEKGLLMKLVHERCQVLRESYEQGGLLVTAKASKRMRETLRPYEIEGDAL